MAFTSVGAPGGTTIQMQWNYGMISYLEYGMLVGAHEIASQAAAVAAVAAINAKAPTGALESDVAVPKSTGPFSSDIGSDLPYAGIQNTGGTVFPTNGEFLWIQADRGSPPYVPARSVTIPAKGYLNAAAPAYVNAAMSALKGLFP